MQNLVKPRMGFRVKRFLHDEWALLALLSAAAVQTGVAIDAMNGMVRSSHAVTSEQMAEAPVGYSLDVAAKRVAMAQIETERRNHRPALQD